MLSKLTTSTKVFLVTSVFALANVGLLIYQFINLKISMWSIIPTAIVVMIFVGNAKNMISTDLSDKKTNTKRSDSSSNVDFSAINTDFPTHLTKSSIITKIVFVGIFIALTVLFSTLSHANYDMVVTGIIKDSYVDGEVYTEVTDDGVYTEDNRYLVLDVAYEIDEVVYNIEVVDNFSTSTRTGETIQLCVKDDASFICVYDNVVSYSIMYYTCIILTVLTALGFVFKLPNQYLVMLVLIFVGAGIICLFNSFGWAGWMLKDFTLFGGCFLTLGVICYIQMVLLRIIYTLHSGDPEYILE